MTERIDLRALAPDREQEERLVGAVMGRLGGRPQLPAGRPPAVLDAVALLPWRWVAAAAAAIILVSALILSLGRNQPPSPEATLASWIDRQHVPTNGELLATFLGYTP
jgi:hypothetical protein